MEQQPRSLSESVLVQNPSLGAYALWKFGLAYQEREGQQVILPLAFAVLPIILHKPTLEILVATQKTSGLGLFVGKLGEKRENLLAVHDRMCLLRRLTLESLIIGERARLLNVNIHQALMRANTLDSTVKMPLLPERIKWLAPSCEKLGHWFAGVEDYQVVRMLNLEM